MSRFKVLALAAVLALGSLSFATEASARGGHGGGHWGGGGRWGGGHFGGFGFHRGFGFGGGPYYAYYPYAGCWRWHRVLTPFGWRLNRVNACYYPYY
ncbi:MAG TPA: sulfur globule protein precursor [Xanthobacteraceae bacterium]